MRTILMLCLSVFVVFQASAQRGHWKAVKGQGPSVEKTLNLDDFSGLQLTLAADVFLTQGNKQSVRVVGQQNIIDLIETEVKNDVWKIKTSQNIRSYDNLKFYITIPSLHYARISGSGDIITENHFRGCKDLTVGVSGSGNLRIMADAQNVDLGISGSGDVELEGNANNLEIHVSGSGDVDAFDMDSNNVDIHVSGSGSCRVNAERELEVHVSGSGDVYYKGSPSVHSRISGSGDLRSM